MSDNKQEDNLYDLVIIGAGPAGLSAGLYGARGNIRTLLLDKGFPGGEMNNTAELENYPGIDHKTGPEISEMMIKHTERFNCEIKSLVDIESVDLTSDIKTIKTHFGEVKAKSVIIATGSHHRELGAPGEKEYSGKGVSYCATCDGAFFRDKHIVVIGGGNAAVEEGNFLTRFGSKVTLVHRRDSLRAEKIVQERAFNNPKMEFVWDTVVESIEGEEKVTHVNIKNVKTGETSKIDCEGVFIFVGLEPNIELFKDQVELDSGNRVVTNDKLETNLKGVFAAGDVRNTPLRQAVTAAADGSITATNAIAYLDSL